MRPHTLKLVPFVVCDYLERARVFQACAAAGTWRSTLARRDSPGRARSLDTNYKPIKDVNDISASICECLRQVGPKASGSLDEPARPGSGAPKFLRAAAPLKLLVWCQRTKGRPRESQEACPASLRLLIDWHSLATTKVQVGERPPGS